MLASWKGITLLQNSLKKLIDSTQMYTAEAYSNFQNESTQSLTSAQFLVCRKD